MPEQEPASRKFTTEEARDFLRQFSPLPSSIEELDKEADRFFDDFMPVSISWLRSGLKGVSLQSKQLVRQYWERLSTDIGDDGENLEESQEIDNLVRAELLVKAEPSERQTIYHLMGSIKFLSLAQINLVEQAPELFKIE